MGELLASGNEEEQKQMNLYLLRNGYTIVNLKGNNEDKISYYKALELKLREKRLAR